LLDEDFFSVGSQFTLMLLFEPSDLVFVAFDYPLNFWFETLDRLRPYLLHFLLLPFLFANLL
jgi:hypothetical protein